MGHGGVGESTEGQSEVEWGAGHDDQVGVAERDRTGPGEAERVVGGEQAAAHVIREGREGHGLDERTHFGFWAGPVDVATDEQDGPFGADQEFSDSGDRVRIRCLTGQLVGSDGPGHGRVGRAPPIERDINEGGPAMRGARGA